MMIMLIDFRFPTMPKVLTWCHVMRLNKINRVSRQLRKAGAHVIAEHYTDNEMRICFTVRNPAILDDMGLISNVITHEGHRRTHHTEKEGVKLDWEVVS